MPPGEQHKQWMDIEAIHWNVARNTKTSAGSALNREASEPSVSEITLTKVSDSSTTKLFQEACVGRSGKTAVIHLVTTGNRATPTSSTRSPTRCWRTTPPIRRGIVLSRRSSSTSARWKEVDADRRRKQVEVADNRFLRPGNHQGILSDLINKPGALVRVFGGTGWEPL